MRGCRQLTADWLRRVGPLQSVHGQGGDRWVRLFVRSHALQGRDAVIERVSRCDTQNDPPLSWEMYDGGPGAPSVQSEIDAMLTGLTRAAKQLRREEIAQVLEDAARGELDGERLVPVNLDPHLWELRWSFGHEHWRMYFEEPPHHAGTLRALRLHRKQIWDNAAGRHLTDAEIAMRQNAEILEARNRLNEWNNRRSAP